MVSHLILIRFSLMICDVECCHLQVRLRARDTRDLGESPVSVISPHQARTFGSPSPADESPQPEGVRPQREEAAVSQARPSGGPRERSGGSGKPWASGECRPRGPTPGAHRPRTPPDTPGKWSYKTQPVPPALPLGRGASAVASVLTARRRRLRPFVGFAAAASNTGDHASLLKRSLLLAAVTSCLRSPSRPSGRPFLAPFLTSLLPLDLQGPKLDSSVHRAARLPVICSHLPFLPPGTAVTHTLPLGRP
ncbi:uncharacterized protein LOC122206942 [Panthera leo]|uniref:uncharacterized protein LOC122206942 n=1 Tax=Panthera leo TaxID=9689 RepID=UPI001C69A239|nr:uncharacterized protein LOC122206942 [Panthera leo]